MKNRLFQISLLLVIVTIAGCAKEQPTVLSGVVIERFEPQLSTVASQSPVEITLLVKNTGERQATGAKAVLGGLPIGTEVSEWRFEEGYNYLRDIEPTLSGVDKEIGFQGEQGIATWILTTPLQNRDQTYGASVNVVYDYSTVATLLIKAVGFDYFQSLSEEQQKSVDTGIVVSKTSLGPLEVSIRSQDAIVSGVGTVPLEITFKNVGGGIVFNSRGDESDESIAEKLYEIITKETGLNKLLVELPSDLQCNQPTETVNEKEKYVVRLVEGKSGRLLCNKIIHDVQTTKSVPVDITVDYRYMIEGKTSIKVSKVVYTPPIIDISVLDSILKMVEKHGYNPSISLDLRVSNKGNRDVTDVEIYVSYTVKADSTEIGKATKILLSPGDTLEKSKFVSLPLDPIVLLDPTTEQITVEISTPAIKVGELDEKNKVNNEFKPPITKTLDYDIAVTDLKASAKSDFSVVITTTIKNNAENVIGQKIPVTISLDDASLYDASDEIVSYELIDRTTCYDPIDKTNSNLDTKTESVEITELRPGKQQQISCLYNNPNQITEFHIKAEVPGSVTEKAKGKDVNNVNDKPNGKDTFTIKYDITIVKGSSSYKVKSTEGNKVTYTLSTKVKNVGGVIAEAIQVQFVDVNVDVNGDSICEAEPKIIDKLESQDSATRTCDTDPVEIGAGEKIQVTAKASSLVKEKEPHEPNEETFYLLPPDTTPPKLSDGNPTGVVLVDNPTLSLETDEPATCGYLLSDLLSGISLTKGENTILYTGPTQDITEATESISSVLESISYYDESDESQPTWRVYTGGLPSDDLTTLENGKSYKVFVNEDTIWMLSVRFSNTGGTVHSHQLQNLADGDYTYNIKCSDAFGNEGTLEIKFTINTIVSLTATSKLLPSNTNYNFVSWTNEDVKVTITCLDALGDSCVTVKYCADKDNTCNPLTEGTEYKTPFKISTEDMVYAINIETTEGITYLRYNGIDNMGNTLPEPKVSEVKIDRTAPFSSEITVVSPYDGTTHPISSAPDSIHGDANDAIPWHVPAQDIRIASGLTANSVKFYLKRATDSKYWTGSTWSSTLTWLSTVHAGTDNNKLISSTDPSGMGWKLNPSVNLPTWQSGTYYIKPRAVDNAGNSNEGNEITFQIQ